MKIVRRGQQLRDLRIAAGHGTPELMARAMAARARVRVGKDGYPSGASLARYERGEPIPLPVCTKIARFLGVAFPHPLLTVSPEGENLVGRRPASVEGVRRAARLAPGQRAH